MKSIQPGLVNKVSVFIMEKKEKSLITDFDGKIKNGRRRIE